MAEMRLLLFLRDLVPPDAPPITADTPLFEGGLVDSVRFMDLFAFVEDLLDIEIPDHMLSTEHFRSVRVILETFGEQERPLTGDVLASPPPVYLPVGVAPTPGGSVVSGPALARLRELESELASLAHELGAAPRRYPSLFPVPLMQRTGYFRSFPAAATLVAQLDPRQVQAARAGQEPQPDQIQPTGQMLTPAVCYHAYAEHKDQELADNLVLTAQSRCYRNEDQLHALTRQWEFTMREIVFIGAPAWVVEQRQRAQERVVALAEGWGLKPRVVAAYDPFFGSPEGRAKVALQRGEELKRELLLDVDGQTVAAASFNLHWDTFGRSFGITQEGQPVHTACVAFGLERWLAALMQ